MWIFSCHAVNDGMIKDFAKEHGCAWKKMTQELKVGTQCGICAKEAKRILEEAAGKSPRKRRKQRTAGDNVSAESTADASQGTAAAASSSEHAVTASSSKTAENALGPDSAAPVFLPCGKCTCTCDK